MSILCGIALIVASWFSFYGTRHFDVFTKSGSIAYNGDEYLVAVKEIQSLTEKDDKVIVIGSDWDPRILYFSDRKGLMIVDKWDPITIIPNSDFGTEYKYVYMYPAAAYDLTSVLNLFRGVPITQVGIGLYEISDVSS